MCPSCGKALNESVYRSLDGTERKSCPRCSQQHGRHAFYAMEAFGKRTMADGSVMDQSWCTRCRSGREADNPVMLC